MSDYSGGYDDSPAFAELYTVTPIYNERADLAFYLEHVQACPGPVLELGCGTGRVLLPAAKTGCSITGIDLSKHMLAVCRERLSKEPQEVQNRAVLVHGDMTAFELDSTFGLVIMPFRPFQHLVSVATQLECLKRIRKHLDIGGRLLFDVFHVDPARTGSPTHQEEEDVAQMALPDGRKFRRTHKVVAVHPAEQYNDIELIFYIENTEGAVTRLVQSFPMRYYHRYELEHLLARSGFRVVELYGDYDKSAFTAESPEMIFLAEKLGDGAVRGGTG